ncbi:hypothetical protein QTI51_25585 [Variovorax sp. J22G73]|uniref:hypothetical protein n=1 Tax=unclassified Variovorax TaxID=663243 RepID=UPI000D5CA3E0|nr:MULTISPECIES: hypothetical protein [unclassified Variovorax]MDM0008169.1 hypothetical protein [Variovorax sp. J22R203]MDM0100675.1 hypothetical protein [Variovorax sp. J22G73]
MQNHPAALDVSRYAKTIEVSKRIRWDIDRDVIRGRTFDLSHTFLPDGLSLADELPFLSPAQHRFMSQVQGRTYANMFGLVERFIGAKMLEVSRDHWLGDQTALEAIVRFTDEELKHQALFRRIEHLVARDMPAGYTFGVSPNDVAAFVLGKCTWAVLALTCHIELFSQAHYRASIEAAEGLSPLFKDVFLFHWREESQHAIIDELEWEREDAKLALLAQRDAAVDDLIALVGGVDGILQGQAKADAAYFLQASGMAQDGTHAEQVSATLLKAYRWQYIVSGTLEPRFQKLLGKLVSEAQMGRIQAALAPLGYAVPAHGVAGAVPAEMPADMPAE